MEYITPRGDEQNGINNYYAVINRIIFFVALLPSAAFAGNAMLTVADLQAVQKTDGLWQPILPPTSADGADALDRQFYAQFANDDIHLVNEPGSSKTYALVPHVSLANFYDDNIALSRTHREGDFALVVEPGLAFGLGDFRAEQNNFLIADYTGRWTAWLDHTSADAYEQFATVRAQLALAKWKFNTNFRFLDLKDVDIDSGFRTGRHIYDTVQVATYEASEKSFVELQGQNIIRDYQTGPGSIEWQGRGLYNFRLDPKLTLGGGMAGGVLDVDGSSGQTYEQALGRVLYDATEKLSFHGQGGAEWRQLASGENKVTPVFDLTCDYHFRPGTKFDLSGYRRNLSSSASGNLDYTAMGVSLSAAQELGYSWLATLKLGYQNNSYFYTSQRTVSPREDNFFYINPTVQFRLNSHAKLEVFYNYRENKSDNYSRAFTDNQTGVRVSFTY